MFAKHDMTKFRSIRPYQVLSEPWRRFIYTSNRNNSMKELFMSLLLQFVWIELL